MTARDPENPWCPQESQEEHRLRIDCYQRDLDDLAKACAVGWGLALLEPLLLAAAARRLWWP
jgi:hypothetical protein